MRGNCKFIFWRYPEDFIRRVGQITAINHVGRIVFIVAHQVVTYSIWFVSASSKP